MNKYNIWVSVQIIILVIICVCSVMTYRNNSNTLANLKQLEKNLDMLQAYRERPQTDPNCVVTWDILHDNL